MRLERSRLQRHAPALLGGAYQQFLLLMGDLFSYATFFGKVSHSNTTWLTGNTLSRLHGISRSGTLMIGLRRMTAERL